MNISSCPQLIIYLCLSLLSLVMSLIFTNKYYDDNNEPQNKAIAFVFHIVIVLLMSCCF